jgi:hypothetical protein
MLSNSNFSPVKYNFNSSGFPQVPDTDSVIKMVSPTPLKIKSFTSDDGGRESAKNKVGFGLNFCLFQSPKKHSLFIFTFCYIVQPHITRKVLFSQNRLTPVLMHNIERGFYFNSLQ